MERFRARQRAEAGETLIEVLISSALMAIVVVAVIGGISTVLISSNIHRTQGNANVALVEAVENMKAMKFSEVNCSPAEVYPDATEARVSKYESVAGAAPGWTATVELKYQQLNDDGVIDFMGDACVPSLPFQLVTVTLESPDTRVSPSMKFLKGNV